ncbi:MAG: response regulator transcription factor [Bacteroidota bacterium]
MMLQPVVLLVEDDPSLHELLQQNLSFEGYEILSARNGQEALEVATSQSVDVMILDLMLPRISGIEVCKQLRATGNQVPIIMLTARDTQMDKIRGLKTGADDYLTKPFDVMELLARIEALLRRVSSKTAYQDQYVLGTLIIDFDQHSIRSPNQQIELTRQEALLLKYLVHHEGRVLSREQIMQDVWGHDLLFSHRTIDTHITRLRQKLEDNPRYPTYILTVHRVGYKFVGPS